MRKEGQGNSLTALQLCSISIEVISLYHNTQLSQTGPKRAFVIFIKINLGIIDFSTDELHHHFQYICLHIRDNFQVDAEDGLVCKHKPWSVVKVSLYYKTTIGHVL